MGTLRGAVPVAPQLPGWACTVVSSLAEEGRPPAFPGPWNLNSGHCKRQTAKDSLPSQIQEGSGVFRGDPGKPQQSLKLSP